MDALRIQRLEVMRGSDVEVAAQSAPAVIGDQYAQRKLVVPPAAPDAVEAYCRLATQLHQAGQSRPLTTVLIASAEPGEGKSLTAANLALALSGSYRKRVVLVDADLRHPSLHKLFDTDNGIGLTDCLMAGGNAAIEPVRLSDTLSLLSGGRPALDPIAALTSNRMKDLLSAQTQQFDWVIVDAPPLGVFPDGHLLASLVDGVVLVVRAGRTPLASVESTVKMVGRKAILGIVLNRSAPTTRARYDRYEQQVRRGQRS